MKKGRKIVMWYEYIADFVSENIKSMAIMAGTIAGLMAALSKSLHNGVIPSASWWAARVCSVLFFAITASWIAEIGAMRPVGVAFLTSILNFLGFSALEIIERRAKRVIEGKEDV
jgi:hypothetical protein